VNVFKLLGLRPRVEIISSRIEGVAVAVRQMIGTNG